MICQPCRDTVHSSCIDTAAEVKRPKRGKLAKVPVSSRCFCQHVVKQVVEPVEGDPHDC